jgi:hypothetical protein
VSNTAEDIALFNEKQSILCTSLLQKEKSLDEPSQLIHLRIVRRCDEAGSFCLTLDGGLRSGLCPCWRASIGFFSYIIVTYSWSKGLLPDGVPVSRCNSLSFAVELGCIVAREWRDGGCFVVQGCIVSFG